MTTVFETMDVTNEMYNLLKWLKNNVSTDKGRESWTGIHVRNNGMVLEATDGFKLVIAKLQNPIDELCVLDNPQNKLTDGIWQPITITKKLIVLTKIENVTFPDTSVILTDYEKPITDSQSFITISPTFLISAINGFDRVDINFVNNERPIQIVLRSNNMPIGTYVAIVMPLLSDYNFDTIQSDIRFVKRNL